MGQDLLVLVRDIRLELGPCRLARAVVAEDAQHLRARVAVFGARAADGNLDGREPVRDAVHQLDLQLVEFGDDAKVVHHGHLIQDDVGGRAFGL